ncbi:MAG: carbohydrate kinase family protein [Candidatus Blackburnbacteria bacterium]|nr:carbohydrate kinase family protein [Candidatus Blackburnbacteria bacterium]
MLDIISIGDSTIDILLGIDPSNAQIMCNLDNEKSEICFSYGSKIPVNNLLRVPASGNAANFSIGTSRLSLKTGIYTVIGSDRDSQDIKNTLEDEGVDTQFVVMEKASRSNMSTILNCGGERTILTYHEPRNYSLPDLPKNQWIYFTSVAKGHETLHKQLPNLVNKTGVKLAFSPGSYQLRESLETLKLILETTTILFVNREEAQTLVKENGEDIKSLLGKLKNTGPEIVVVTDGNNGSYASFDGREVWHVGIPHIEVVEKTGAGDSYAAAFLAALVKERDLPEAMIWGTMNAASVVQYAGAHEGLLTPVGMEEFLEKYRDQVKPKML